MKKKMLRMLSIGLIAGLTMFAGLFLVACGDTDLGYNKGYDDGYDKGHGEGYDEGYADGENASQNPEIINFDCDFDIVQDASKQQIIITWDSEESVTSLEVVSKTEGEVYSTLTAAGKVQFSKNQYAVELPYGLYDVTVTASTADGKVATDTIEEVSVSAEEYNIAPLSGSMPVLLFTLDLVNNPTEIPTFVWLNRAGAWDWDNLPENVYTMPNATKAEYTAHNTNIHLMYAKTNKYIKNLYAANPDSVFNLYLNDYDVDQYLHMLVGNGIPEENYNVYLLSDGAFSYSTYIKAYNVADATTKHASMITAYETLVGQVEEAGYYDFGNAGDKFEMDGFELRNHLYVMAEQNDNIEWWISRMRQDIFNIPNDTSGFKKQFFSYNEGTGAWGTTSLISGIKEKAIGTILSSIQGKNRADELKAVYKFSDDMFAEAETQGKKAMMFLGSYANATNEPDFMDYAQLMMDYYGDEYVYYYKGHPNTPTGLFPNKQEQLDELGWIDLDSTIAAELILFFFPGIYMCGYDSSTYTSVESPEMACAMFNMTKAIGSGKAYGHLLDMFVTKLAKSNATYGELLNDTDTYYLVEYNDTEDFDFAIYNSTEGEFTNYKIVDGEFVSEADLEDAA